MLDLSNQGGKKKNGRKAERRKEEKCIWILVGSMFTYGTKWQRSQQVVFSTEGTWTGNWQCRVYIMCFASITPDGNPSKSFVLWILQIRKLMPTMQSWLRPSWPRYLGQDLNSHLSLAVCRAPHYWLLFSAICVPFNVIEFNRLFPGTLEKSSLHNLSIVIQDLCS